MESCRESGDEVLCRTAGGQIGIAKEQVERIERDAPPKPAAARASVEALPRSVPPTPPGPLVISAESAAILPGGSEALRARLADLETSLGRPGVDDAVVRREMAVLHTYMGNEAAGAGDFDAAEAAYLRASDHDPQLAPPRLNLVRLRLREGRNEEAGAILARVRADHPDSASVIGLQGEVAYRTGRLQEAIELWERSLAIQSDPDLEARLRRIRKEGEVEQGFSRADGAHFILKYDGERASDSLGREILRHLDDAFDDLTLRFNVLPSSPIVVTLYSREAFHDVTESPRWVGGLFDGQIRIPIGGLARLTEVARDVFTHELTHCIVFHKTRGNCPRWLQEGIAQWAEGKSARSQRRALARELAGAGPVGAEADLTYPQALSLLEHFLETWTFSHLLDLLDGLGRGAGFEAAFEEVTGQGWSGFAESWRASLHAPGGVG